MAQPMDNSSSDPTTPHEPGEGKLPDQDAISRLAGELETDENLKRLAEKLGKEWKGKPGAKGAPDLSYQQFEKKLKADRDQ